MSVVGSLSEWISSQAALAEIRQAMPNQHAGKELCNGAMKAGLPMRARLAVFITNGNGQLDRREADFDVPAQWWWPTDTPDHRFGLQVIEPEKGEAWAVIDIDGQPQRIELFGISFRRTEFAAHFNIALPDAPATKPSSRRGAKPKYDWPAFQRHARERLEHHGGFLGIDWRQSDLEREMADWCLQTWDTTPGESTVRKEVVKAASEYEAEKAGQ